jgi:hypothetical protein
VHDTVKKVGKNGEKRGAKGKISRVLELAIFTILTSRLDKASYSEQFHFLITSEKSRGLDFKPIEQNKTFCLECEKKVKKSYVLKLAIFTILTAGVDVASYFEQFYFLITTEKARGLDFKPLEQNHFFCLKCEKKVRFRVC